MNPWMENPGVRKRNLTSRKNFYVLSQEYNDHKKSIKIAVVLQEDATMTPGSQCKNLLQATVKANAAIENYF